MGPIGLILFILAGIYGVRRGKITSLSPTDFPTVPPDRFEAWRRLELKSIDIFLLVAAAVFAMSILGQIVVSLSPHGRNISPGLVAAVVLIGAAVLTFFVGLTVSAVIGSKATRLKKSLGIHWSEKQ